MEKDTIVVNLPNALSLIRIAMIPIVTAFLCYGWYLDAAILFVLAALTDILDGYFARKNNLVSPLGFWLDLLADKLLVSVILVVMAGNALLPPWIVIILIGREIAVMAVRVYAGAQGMLIPPGLLGKSKTLVLTFGVTIVIIGQYLKTYHGTESSLFFTATQAISAVGFFALLVACLLALVSGFEYLSRAAVRMAGKTGD